MNSPAPIRGLLLSGGFSTRMGRDKGTMIWQHEPLIRHQLQLLHTLTDNVLISCREEQRTLYSSYGELLIDQLPPSGPISGLLTAFRHDPSHAWLVIPVDMPHMDQVHLARLIDARDQEAIATVFIDPVHQILQPLAAIWEPSSMPILESAWTNERFSLRRLLEKHRVASVPVESSHVLHNLNRPEDLISD